MRCVGRGLGLAAAAAVASVTATTKTTVVAAASQRGFATTRRMFAADEESGSGAAEKSEFARMDMKTKNETVGKYKDVERQAIAQEEGRVPLPEGARAAVAGADAGCGCGHGDHSAAASSAPVEEPPAGGYGGASNSAYSGNGPLFSKVFNEEAAAMLASAGQHQGGARRADDSVAAATGEHRHAEEEMQRFLAQNTLRSIQRSAARDRKQHLNTSNVAVDSAGHRRTHGSDCRLPPGRRGVQALLDYNKQWAAEVSRFNPRYFQELAKEQKPEYLWIGCSDSRVPANEVIGLHPGDVFVHRNIGNICSLSDLNCLSALQFAVDSLKVQHVIIAGHYKCGGVTAAMQDATLGLTDHWIMQVTDIKNKFWDRVTLEIPEADHLNVLCELNVLEQLSHAVSCRIIQRKWKQQNDTDRFSNSTSSHVFVRPRYASDHNLRFNEHHVQRPIGQDGHVTSSLDEVECHGWVYSLDDGMLRPMLSLNRLSKVKQEIEAAVEAVFVRYTS